MQRFQTLFLILFVASVAFAAPSQGADRPPNIVFILIDDMGWMDVGCNGNRYVETPNIDRLAAQGVRFTDFYAASPVCSSTRASIQSGQYPARVGITDFIPGHWRPYERLVVAPLHNELSLQIPTVAETLKAAGYRTGYFGKWHLGPNDSHHPTRQGYDDAIVTGGRHFRPNFRAFPDKPIEDGTYQGDFLTDQTLRFITENKEKPFFVTLSHFAIHIPLEARQELIDKYTSKFANKASVLDFDSVESPAPNGDAPAPNPIYAAMIEHVDESVGRVVAKLDELGLTGNTMVVFTSDNGGLYRRYDGGGDAVTTNWPLRGEKGTIYEGGIRVPMIVRLPGVTPVGAVCDEPTTTADLYPTFAELGGAAIPTDHVIDGISMMPLLGDPAATLGREAIYFHYPHYHHSKPAGAIRSDEWKLVEFFDDNRLELYDLSADIGESTNLAAQHPRRALEMRRNLAEWRVAVGAKMPQPNPSYDAAKADQWWNRHNNQPLNREAMNKAYGERKSKPK